MYKLKYKMIDRMIKSKVSSKEIDFILFLTKSTNELGQARDIHYKEVCNELNISKQTFYNIVEHLRNVNILIPSYENKCTWDFTFSDNIFLSYDDLKESYLNTNRDFLFSNDFKSLKANEKLLILKLLVLTGKNSFKISLFNLKKWFNIKCNCVILGYIKSLERYFDISLNGTVYSFVKKTFLNDALISAKSKNFKNRLRRWCLKYKIAFAMQDLDDIYNIFYVFESNFSKFFNVLVKTAFDYKQLQPAIVNYIMSI